MINFDFCTTMFQCNIFVQFLLIFLFESVYTVVMVNDLSTSSNVGAQ